MICYLKYLQYLTHKSTQSACVSVIHSSHAWMQLYILDLSYMGHLQSVYQCMQYLIIDFEGEYAIIVEGEYASIYIYIYFEGESVSMPLLLKVSMQEYIYIYIYIQIIPYSHCPTYTILLINILKWLFPNILDSFFYIYIYIYIFPTYWITSL